MVYIIGPIILVIALVMAIVVLITSLREEAKEAKRENRQDLHTKAWSNLHSVEADTIQRVLADVEALYRVENGKTPSTVSYSCEVHYDLFTKSIPTLGKKLFTRAVQKWRDYVSVHQIENGYIIMRWTFVPSTVYTKKNNTIVYNLHDIVGKETGRNKKITPIISEIYTIGEPTANTRKAIQQGFTTCKLSPRVEKPQENTTTVYELRYNFMGGVQIAPMTTDSYIKYTKEIEDNYADVLIEDSGKKFLYKMKDLVNLIVKFAPKGLNTQITGGYGVGKSSLLMAIMHKLSSNNECVVLKVSPQEFSDLDPIKFKNAISKIRDHSEKRIVVIMDEMDFVVEAFNDQDKKKGKTNNTLLTTLLSMMSGTERETLNISFILSYNTERENVLDSLYRDGRNDFMVEISELSAEKAKARLDKASKQDDVVVDWEKYERVIKTQTKYSQKGAMSLAELFSCIKSKELKSEIDKALEAARKEITTKAKK